MDFQHPWMSQNGCGVPAHAEARYLIENAVGVFGRGYVESHAIEMTRHGPGAHQKFARRMQSEAAALQQHHAACLTHQQSAIAVPDSVSEAAHLLVL